MFTERRICGFPYKTEIPLYAAISGRIRQNHVCWVCDGEKEMRNKIKRLYFKIFLTLWAIFKLPRKLKIADTEIIIPAWDWRVSLLCRIPSTIISNGRISYEPVDFEPFKKIIENASCFYDVGANIGYYSLLAAGHGVKQISAFECIPEYADFIERAFKINNIKGNVICGPVGDGSSVFYSDSIAQGKESRSIKLDDYAKKTGIYPDALKMDIEGYEEMALQNASEILKRKPAIDISIHPSYLNHLGSNRNNVIRILKEAGYEEFFKYYDTHFLK